MRISSYYYGKRQSDRPSQSTRKRPYHEEDSSLLGWAKQFDGLALFLFAFGIIFLHGYGQRRTLGLFMGFAFIKTHGRRFFKDMRFLFSSPPELKLYTVWVLWAGITGILVAVDMDAFWIGYRVLLQMLVMIWIVYCVLRFAKDTFNAVFIGIVCGGLIQIGYLLSEPQNLMVQLTTEQFMGETANPNTLGFMMIWALLCALMFWWHPGRIQKWFRIGTIFLLPFCVFVLLSSGSRKSALLLLFFIGVWTIFASSMWKKSKGTLTRLSLFVMFVYASYALIPFLLENTLLGNRFLIFYVRGGDSIWGGVEANIRYWMYVEGWKIFIEHPFWGVGLNNFGNYFFSGQYSHSDYIEPLATTGLIGFLLYQSFYVLVLYRAIRLIRIVRDVNVLYRLKMVVIGVLTINVLGFGAPHYISQPVFILLTTFSVYTWQILRQVQYERTQGIIRGSDIACPRHLS